MRDDRDHVVGLIGAGIGASLSPALHEREAAHLGLGYDYRLHELDPDACTERTVAAHVAGAHAAGYSGLNVTHPCKQLVVPALDALAPEAAALGAVNTVVFDGDRAVGHNTDWPGFQASFARGFAGAPTEDVVLLGAGGAGAAVAHGALSLGVGRLAVVDADDERAVALAGALAARFGGQRARPAAAAELPALLARADGLIHATPTGMAEHPGTALDPALLHAGLWVVEVVYRPLETALLRAARDAGCRTLDGGGMAVFQAAGSLELFTGRRPDAARMLRHFAALTAPPAREEAACAGRSPRSR